MHQTESPFYDKEFAAQRVKEGRLVRDEICKGCRMPPPADWCWAHDPTCPLHMPLRGAAATTVRCEFSMFGMAPKPGTMTFRHGSNFAMFVADDGRTRQYVRLDVLGAQFTESELP